MCVASRHEGVFSGGIVGMGETQNDRAGLLQQLSNLNPHPESVPINNLVKVEGTPLENEVDLDPFDFLRTIAVSKDSDATVLCAAISRP
jgi:biotin synthase